MDDGPKNGKSETAAPGERIFTTPSGRGFRIRKGYGRDLIKAQRAAAGGDATAVVFALVAELAMPLSGPPLVYEDMLDMELADVVALQGEVVGGNFQPPTAPASPPSSGSDSPRRN